MGVAVVAVVDIGKHVCHYGLLAFLYQFFVPPFGTHLGRGGEEEFEFCFRKDHCTYIASVHHYAAILAHLLLLCYQVPAHLGNNGNLRCTVAYLQRADLLFHILAVERHVLCAIRLDSKIDMHLWQQCNDI